MSESKINTTVGIKKLKMLYKAALLLHYFNTQFFYRIYSGREALNLYKDTLKCSLHCSEILCSVMWCVTP